MTHIRKPIQIVVAPSNEGSDQFVALADDGTMWLREGYWTKECPDGGVIDGYTVPLPTGPKFRLYQTRKNPYETDY